MRMFNAFLAVAILGLSGPSTAQQPGKESANGLDRLSQATDSIGEALEHGDSAMASEMMGKFYENSAGAGTVAGSLPASAVLFLKTARQFQVLSKEKEGWPNRHLTPPTPWLGQTGRIILAGCTVTKSCTIGPNPSCTVSKSCTDDPPPQKSPQIEPPKQEKPPVELPCSSDGSCKPKLLRPS